MTWGRGNQASSACLVLCAWYNFPIIELAHCVYMCSAPLPLITAPPESVVVEVGQIPSFSCSANSEVNWMVVDSSGMIVEFSTHGTNVATVNVTTPGEYNVTCFATNEKGIDSKSATLIVVVGECCLLSLSLSLSLSYTHTHTCTHTFHVHRPSPYTHARTQKLHF